MFQNQLYKKEQFVNETVFRELFELSQDPYSIQLKIEELQNKTERELIIRLKKWFSFFNLNYSKCLCFYNQTILALFEATENNKLFKAQTTYEFDLSLNFYNRLLDSKLFIEIEDLESATYLLNISLVYAKYPGMVIRSFNQSLLALKSGINNYSLQTFFENLFVKYESPKIFIKNLNRLSLIDIEILMFVLQGNNLRTHEKLPYSISKMESYILINKLPDNLMFDNQPLERAIICSKLLNQKDINQQLLIDFIKASRTFKYKPDVFIEDIDFWKRGLKQLSTIDFENSYLTVQEYVDYFEYQKYSVNYNFSLNGRTINSISQAINDWHNQLDFSRKMNLIGLKWQRQTDKNTILEEENIKYEFCEITNGDELFMESKELNHCVFSYIESCAYGHLSIWSLKKEENSRFVPFITIEVSNNKINQMKGKNNRQIDEAEFKLIKKWAQKMEYKIEYEFI